MSDMKWVVEVLEDLRTHAIENANPRLAAMLAKTKVIALEDICDGREPSDQSPPAIVTLAAFTKER